MSDIKVKCTRCRHECMESAWVDKPSRLGFSGRGVPVLKVTDKVCPKCGCKSYYDMTPQFAWCWATGLIEMGDQMPAEGPNGSGAIGIAHGPKSALKITLEVKARHSDSGQLLVPGVPEAETEEEAGDALAKWLEWCAKSNGKKHSNGVVFAREIKS